MQNVYKQSAFWDYSIALYAVEDVAPACLSLQDRYGFDVNLVLFCLWYGSCKGKIPRKTLAEALKLSSHWSKMAVLPLRNVRTAIKKDTQQGLVPEAEDIARFRDQVKKLELKAEKIQQQMLERLALKDEASDIGSEDSGQTSDDAGETLDYGEANLSLLVAAMNLELNCKTQPQMQVILSARERLEQQG